MVMCVGGSGGSERKLKFSGVNNWTLITRDGEVMEGRRPKLTLMCHRCIDQDCNIPNPITTQAPSATPIGTSMIAKG